MPSIQATVVTRTAIQRRSDTSFQEIKYPDWDVSFCHECSLDSSLVDLLATAYNLDLTFDFTLYMADVDQIWKRAWLYEPTDVNADTIGDRAAPADD